MPMFARRRVTSIQVIAQHIKYFALFHLLFWLFDLPRFDGAHYPLVAEGSEMPAEDCVAGSHSNYVIKH